MEKDQNSLLRLKQVLEIIPVCKATFYNGIKAGYFPEPIKIEGCRASFWRYSDITRIIESWGGESEC